MTQNIRDVLNRRGDLSTFVVHLTRDRDAPARDNLHRIIAERTLIAGSAMGWAADQDVAGDAAKQSQRVVSFSETPLEHIYSLVADIADRRVRLQPYGLALTKMKARVLGVNPVWYVDMTIGRTWQQAAALNQMADVAKTGGSFHTQPVASILPFIEPMGTWINRQREFWWEREWRHAGDLRIDDLGDVALWLSPENEIDDLVAFVQSRDGMAGRPVHCVDPRWGMEQIIASLVGQDDISPFTNS